jgi:acyl-CoA thioester hydrolase
MHAYATKIELRVDWNDIELFEHANNISVLRYIQSARVNFLEAVGLMQWQRAEKKGPVLVSTSPQFFRPIFYPGIITVYSSGNAVKNTSFTIQHSIRDSSNDVTNEATDIIVLFDFSKNTKIAIPDNLRDRIEHLGHQPIQSVNV